MVRGACSTPTAASSWTCWSPPERARRLKDASRDWPSRDLTPRQLRDLELLTCGGLSPLRGFLTQEQCDGVRRRMRLPDGTFWPAPIVLDVSEDLAAGLSAGDRLALRDPEGVMLAALHVADVWREDAADGENPFRVGGDVDAVETARHYDFRELRLPPARTREKFGASAGLVTGGVLRRGDLTAALRAADNAGGKLLLLPLAGGGQADEPDFHTRVRCCRAALARAPEGRAAMNLMPLADHGGGDAETLLRAIVARNYGCSHLIVAADELPALQARRDELGIEGVAAAAFSGDRLCRRLAAGEAAPPRSSFPEVVRELRRAVRPRAEQGFTVFFTGLPSSGKSTLANVLAARLREIGGRPVTLLDGDLVRKHLSSELGFSKADRDVNIRRIGWVASEITRNGGVAICAPIAPYERIRRQVREMIAPKGGYILVHVSTPVEVCEQRDRKGLYAKARAGLIAEFTGISDPYEAPTDADLTFDTTDRDAQQCVAEVLDHLREAGYLPAP